MKLLEIFLTRKHFLLFPLLVFSAGALFCQSKKEKLFNETVTRVIEAFSKQDSIALAGLTDPKTSVYHLYRGNTYLGIITLAAVSFTTPGRFANQLRDCKNIQPAVLEYTKLPEWNCDTEEWDKRGLFVDTTLHDHMLSEGCIFKNRYEPGSYPQKLVAFYKKIEARSRRVILQDANGKELCFYLTLKNGRWYLTIIDKASSDCSV
ncbi:MAG TPA: hypothetical protein VG738_15780 [Chitinophagaceae bacterium]|nr:hypothetical protein [Chitinophagaceae bacterium]